MTAAISCVRCPECNRALTVPDTATTFGPHATQVAPIDPQPCGGADWLIETEDLIDGRWPR